jgi:hypothetical protein
VPSNNISGTVKEIGLFVCRLDNFEWRFRRLGHYDSLQIGLCAHAQNSAIYKTLVAADYPSKQRSNGSQFFPFADRGRILRRKRKSAGKYYIVLTLA